jgi:Protein of unknown function (DUF2958)
VRLSEILRLRDLLDLPGERDRHFCPGRTMSVYATAATGRAASPRTVKLLDEAAALAAERA